MNLKVLENNQERIKSVNRMARECGYLTSRLNKVRMSDVIYHAQGHPNVTSSDLETAHRVMKVAARGLANEAKSSIVATMRERFLIEGINLDADDEIVYQLAVFMRHKLPALKVIDWMLQP